MALPPKEKTDRKYDIFASDIKANDGIRVGYIDPKRGYVSGLSVYRANKYAERNPGTQFILATRDEVKYLNINEVNKLTNENIVPKNSPKGIVNKDKGKGDGELDPCNTVRGFATDAEQSSRGDLDNDEPKIFPPGGSTNKGEYNASYNYKRFKKNKTRIELQGGGGIGALASPIIGSDGSIIHCRVIDGGFGYKIAPQVRIIDDNRRGAGSKAYSVLGTIGYTQENYDDEDDFEEYDFDIGEYNFDSTDASWGSIYNLGTQTVIGEWNPANVISLTNPENGFADQLTRYLEFLKGYDPNKPWWTTRDESPVRVAGNKKQRKANGLGAVLFPVEHHAWGGDRELDDLFVDVEFEVYGQGTYKNRNIFFRFKAEDGSHQFRVKGVTNEKKSRSGKRRTQIVSLKANTNYIVTSNVRKKIKNADKKVVEQGIAKQFGGTKEDSAAQKDGGKSKIIFADVVGSANDNDDIQVKSNIGSFKVGDKSTVKVDDAGLQNTEILETIINFNNKYKRGTFDLTYRLNRRKDKTFTTEITDSFMNKYAVCPELPSNVEGTDKAGIPYSLIYKEYFPHEGKYTFRGASDNIGEVFLDGVSIMDISNTFKGNQKKVKRKVTKGLHKIRIDLENKIQKKIVDNTYTSDGAKDAFKKLTVKFKVVYSGSARHRKIKCIFTSKTNPNESFTIYHDGKNNEVKERGYAVIPNEKYKVQFVATAERKTNGQREFNIEYEGLNSANQGPVNSIEVSDNNKTIKLRDGDGNDTNTSFKVMPGSPGTSAKFSDDGKKLLVNGGGEVTLRLKWDDNPNTGGVAVKKIKIAGKTWKQKGQKDEQTETIDFNSLTEPFVLEQGIIKNGTKDKEGGGGSSTKIFGDYVGSANDNDDMQIYVTKGGDFTASKKREVTGESNPKREKETRHTRDLEFIFQDETLDRGLKKNLLELVENKTGQSLERSDIELTDVFDTKSFISKANRSLYRVESATRFGDFFSRYAVTPFNPLEVDPEIIDVKPIVIEKPAPIKKPKVKFEREGGPNGELFMKVIGSGKAKIGFKLKVDDNLRTSGLAVREVKIESDAGYVNLKRDIKNINIADDDDDDRFVLVGKEEEKIKGFGEFTAGKTYKVIASGGSSTSGFQTVDRTIVFDDDYQNGWDENAGLEIDYITVINPPKSKPANPPKDGKNNSSKKSLDNVEGSADDYAGTHEIVWKDLNFPYDGIYNIDVQVDDSVRIEIFNKKFQAQTLDVKGFRGKKNILQSFSVEVKKGKYTLKASLVQLPGKSIIDGNPMGLAIFIKTASVTVKEEIILNKSWQQNPFGAALTIHAPPPPIPQELPLVQDGPCPPNPIWTTRSRGFVDQWYPCSHRRPGGGRTWSKFMNRYAMSPVLPIGSKGSGYSGQQWTNSWDVNIPFTGFYNFKGTSDNASSCIISQTPENGGTSEVSEYRSVEVKKINGFRTEKRDLTSNKIFLEKGEAKIEITVQNGERIKYREVTRKVFNTSDWLTKSVRNEKNKIPADFKVYGQGSKSSMEIKAIFKEKGGDHSFTIDNVEKSKTTESITKKVKPNTDYKVTFVGVPKTTKTKITPTPVNTESVYPIEIAAPGTKGRGDKAVIVEVTDDKIIYTDTTDQMDYDAHFKIVSTSPGVTAKFSRDGSELIVKGVGDVTLELFWSDDPNSNGKAVGSIKVAGKTFNQTSHQNKKDTITETITVGNSNSGSAVASNASSGTKEILFKFSHDDANDGNRIKIPGLSINSVKPSGSKGDFDPEESTATVENGREYVVEFVTENKAFLKLKDDGKTIWCNDNSDNDDKDAVITTSDGTFFDLVDGGDNGQPSNIGRAKFRFGQKSTPTPTPTPTPTYITTTDGGILEQGCMSKGFGQASVKNEAGQKKPSNIVFGDYVRSSNDNNDMMIQCAAGIFTPSDKTRTKFDVRRGKKVRRGTWDLTYRLDDRLFKVIDSITEVDGATYEIKDKETSTKATTSGSDTNSRIIENTDAVILNPTLTTYKRGLLGRLLTPFFPKGRNESGENLQGRTWEMVWEDVKFPIDGEYIFEAEVDDKLKIEISEDKVELDGDASMTTKDKVNYKTIKTVRGRGKKEFSSTTITSGKRNVKLTLSNLKISGTSFKNNPTYAACKITCKEPVELADQRPWLVNPVGVSAVLISPPCDRKVGGGGTVTEVNIIEEGNSYTPDEGGIPGQVVITEIIPDSPIPTSSTSIELVGIGTFPIKKGPFDIIDTVIIPGGGGDPDSGDGDGSGDSGTTTGIGTGSQRIPGIPPIIITRTPNIVTTPPQKFIIKTKLIVDTPTAPPDTVIQITDLAGLKQTGYIEGRAYYGEVFFKDGTPFAGRYETAGRPIQVYATLQESIDSEVTTRPSAIQRSGTDVNSNNPRLNIPGTPNNLA